MRAKNCEGPNLDCSNIRCLAHFDFFDFRVVDKTTGEDLVFGPSPRYNTNDIKLFFDQARTLPMHIQFDQAKKNIQTADAKEVMYLEVKGNSVYKLETVFKLNDCCSNRVKTVWLNGRMLCSCCQDVVALPID